MNDLISVIVPIYNAEKTIKRCLDSIIFQTYKNIEIILIDDGSKDSSFALCKKYSDKDRRIVLFHKENGGEASSRNFGILKSNGKYVAFVDSDDFVDNKFLEILYNNIVDTDSDISICNYDIFNDKKFHKNSKKSFVITYNKKQSFENLSLNKGYYGYCWNKLYKKEILLKMGDNLVNEKIHMCDDLEFNSRYFTYIKKSVFTTDKLYYYYLNPNSVTGNMKLNSKVLTVNEAYNNIIPIFEKYTTKGTDNIIYNYLKMQLNINYRYYIENKKHKLIKDKYYYRFLKEGNVNLFKKSYIYLSYKFPIFTSKLKYNIREMRSKHD